MYNYQTKGTNKKIENKSKGNFLKKVLNEQCKKKKYFCLSVNYHPLIFLFFANNKNEYFFCKI
jgi:hypothetical protein